MTSLISPRLRKPAVYGLGGLLFAGAWLVHGGRLWWVAVPALVFTAVRVARLYWLGGQDTDEGAWAGSRPDERQREVSARSRALACDLAAIASFLGLVAGIAAGASWWWPFLVTLVITGYGYLFGLGRYGIAEEGVPDDGPR